MPASFEDFGVVEGAAPAPAGTRMPLTSGVGGSPEALDKEIARTTNPQGKADLLREKERLNTPIPVAGTKTGFEAYGPLPDGTRGDQSQSPREDQSSILSFGKATLAEAVSLGDLVASIPAQLIGVGADLGMRARAIGEGEDRRGAALSGKASRDLVNEKLGNPLHKLVALAGLGQDEGQTSTVDAAMGRLSSWLGKGGEWVEERTGGAVLKEDVDSIVSTVMASAGGRGLAAGLEKVVPKGMQASTVKMSPEALQRMQDERGRAMDPKEAAKVPEATAAAAEKAATKGRLIEGKALVFDPVKGELGEAIPEMGKPLPKPSTLETALDKMADGRAFDMTAEERIAYRGWDKAEPPTPLVDEQGTPLREPTPRELNRNSQAGAVDPKLLASMAAIGLGAWAGQHFGSEHDLFDAALGAGAALAISKATPRRAVQFFRDVSKPDPRIRINEISDAHEKLTKMAAIDTWGLQKQITDLVPKAERRAAITHAVEAGDLSGLSGLEQKAAGIYTDFASQKLWEGIDAGVLKSARDDYVTHLWDWSRNDKSLLAKWLDRSGGGGGGTNFAKERSIPTIAEGKAQGLIPLTEDISTIMGVYSNSLTRAIANKYFVEALKNERTPAVGEEGPLRSLSLVMQADKAPHSYVSINTPSFAGLRVHPDIAPSVKLMFDTSQPGAAMKIAMGLSDTVKRVAVSFSLFHAKALTDAMIGGSSNPFKALIKLPGFVAGTDMYLQELKKGSASPLVQRAVDGGLVFSLERAGPGVEDAGAGFYSTMTHLQGMMDKTIPGAGLPIKGLVALNEKMDTLMWARLHAGMKLNMFAEKYQQLIDNSARAAGKGKGQALTPEQASRIAASYTNDLFGGLNWRRVADDATTRFGRDLGQTALTPSGRRAMQLIMFAPDWTISTTRAAVQAFGTPDMLNPKTLAGLHQQYLLRSAMYYLVVGDAINYSMSGHHLWQNKDSTVLDMNPEGTKHMQWSKHTMEPVHWVTKPAQQAINKLGFIPREAADQALGVEYLSSKGRMPPMQNRVRHFASNFAPIAVQQAQQGGTAAALSGLAGAPIYGQTAAEKEAARAKRKAQREAAK